VAKNLLRLVNADADERDQKVTQEQFDDLVEAGLSKRTIQAAAAAGWSFADLMDPAKVDRAAFLALPRVGKTSWREIERIRYQRTPDGVREGRIFMLRQALDAANAILDALREEDPEREHPPVHVTRLDGRLVAVQAV
jgi:hypothetical protein